MNLTRSLPWYSHPPPVPSPAGPGDEVRATEAPKKGGTGNTRWRRKKILGCISRYPLDLLFLHFKGGRW